MKLYRRKGRPFSFKHCHCPTFQNTILSATLILVIPVTVKQNVSLSHIFHLDLSELFVALDLHLIDVLNFFH
jgi:hypothetical protein